MNSLKRKSGSYSQATTCVTPTKKRRVPPTASALGSGSVMTPSTSQIQETPASTSTPPRKASPKKGKKKQDPDSIVPEKRGARFRATCPQNITERVHRVMSQRFFMIDRNRTPEALQEVFSVLGSTGNVYTVLINHKPSCDCPDASKGNHCKHILFVFLKVLQVPQSSGLWYQKALLSSELQTIFDQAPLAPTDVASARVREAHARATGKSPETLTPEPSNKRRIPGPDDDCPICYESMDGAGEASLTFCDECGNALHKECFRQWQASTVRDGKTLTCVWCRATWAFSGASGSERVVGASTNEGYLNFGTISGASPVRDTSTYYHGYRRGYRFRGY